MAAAPVLRLSGRGSGRSRYSRRFRLLHLGDTMVLVDPEGLPDRLRAAGFDDPKVSTGPASFRFRARKS